MAIKRGQSGLSCLLAIDKPVGKSSHDIVNIARRSLAERRIGHAGTLDPFASGLLILMAGPAARLDKYLTSEEKSYVATIVFGISTDTDDCTGRPISSATPQQSVTDLNYAESVIDTFIGPSMQLPPVYSAIKVKGKKSYEEARQGNIIKLKPRPIDVKAARVIETGTINDALLSEIQDVASRSFRGDGFDNGLFSTYLDLPYWTVEFRVSKGTYIRSLARDIGLQVGCHAHLASLRRVSSGYVSIEDCSSVAMLEANWRKACIDPVYALGFKVLFADKRQAVDVGYGRRIEVYQDQLLSILHNSSVCECFPPLTEAKDPLSDGEYVTIIVDNDVKAIYRYSAMEKVCVPECVFNIGVSRGNTA